MTPDPIRFTQDEKDRLSPQLKEAEKNNRKNANLNYVLDVIFKILISCFGAGVAICTALIALDKGHAAKILIILNIVFGACSALLSGLALTQFNLAGRSAAQHKIANNYANLETKLEFSDPGKDELLAALAELRAWGPNTPLDAKIDFLQR